MDKAKEGVMTCGRVAIGREMVVGAVEARSWTVDQLVRTAKARIQRTFLRRFVASMRTSVSGRKL